MARVLLRGVTKRFGNTVAVERIDLEVPDREFVVLVGPSGCGKTTALRLVAGLEEATNGEIYIGERLVNRVAPKDRNVAMVFQSYALYPHMNVYKNMAIGLELRKFPRQEIDRRVREAAEILGLDQLLERRPAALSGGERQRVAMGRAIVRKPDLFLFDEPLSNLDAKLRIKMRAEIKQLHGRLRTTILYVTHDQVEAMTLADRIVVMNKGVIMQEGAPLEVYGNPKNLFVAGFIGAPSMNFLKARLSRTDGGLALKAEGIELPVTEDKRSALTSWVERELILGVRPEHLLLSAGEGREADQGVIEGDLQLLEPLGSGTLVHFKAGGQEVVAICDPERTPAKKGKARFLVESRRIHLFDPQSEAAII